jgi:AcrR family transcriptional regulator
MMDVAEPGLRERKRLATHRAIQIAALRLVHERGLDSVTIDDISRVADISPRTFFNYFPSKEEALVGDGPNFPSQAAIEIFVAGTGNLLGGIGDLMLDSATDALHDHEIIQLRKLLAADYPHLTALRMQTFRVFEQKLVEIVTRRMATEFPEMLADPARLESRAALVTQVAIAAVHHAWRSWAGNPLASETLADRLAESFAELDDVLGTLTTH